MGKKSKQNNSFCADAQNVAKKMADFVPIAKRIGIKDRRLFRPLCIVVSSPSGGGKTTLCQRLLGEFPDMAYSISCTTRVPRPGEVDGKNYYFLAEPEFKRRVAAGFFLEHALVHDHWYGTPKPPIMAALGEGRDVLLAIDVQGAERIRALLSDPALATLKQAFVDVFIVPPSLDALRQRLEGRGQDTEETINRRLANAEKELACRDQYKYVVVNDRLDDAYQRLKNIIQDEHRRVV